VDSLAKQQVNSPVVVVRQEVNSPVVVKEEVNSLVAVQEDRKVGQEEAVKAKANKVAVAKAKKAQGVKYKINKKEIKAVDQLDA
jgi:hypothetical protein